MAYTKLPATPLELEELLELEDELEELEDELEALEDELDELDDELEELLEDPPGEVCAPPQAARMAMSDRGNNSRILKVKPSKSSVF